MKSFLAKILPILFSYAFLQYSYNETTYGTEIVIVNETNYKLEYSMWVRPTPTSSTNFPGTEPIQAGRSFTHPGPQKIYDVEFSGYFDGPPEIEEKYLNTMWAHKMKNAESTRVYDELSGTVLPKNYTEIDGKLVIIVRPTGDIVFEDHSQTLMEMVEYLSDESVSKSTKIYTFSTELAKHGGGVFNNYHRHCKQNKSWKTDKENIPDSANSPWIGPMRSNEILSWAEGILCLSHKNKFLSTMPYRPYIKKYPHLEQGLRHWAQANGFDVFLYEKKERIKLETWKFNMIDNMVKLGNKDAMISAFPDIAKAIENWEKIERKSLVEKHSYNFNTFSRKSLESFLRKMRDKIANAVNREVSTIAQEFLYDIQVNDYKEAYGMIAPLWGREKSEIENYLKNKWH